MTELQVQPSFEWTSAAGAMMRQMREPVLVGVMLVGLGTSSAYASTERMPMTTPDSVDQTTAGAAVLPSEAVAVPIAELRRLSGFTWDQLARLFNVSRRSVHFWASGKTMTAGNEEHLQRLLAVIRKTDRGSPSANRAVMLKVQADGTIPFDLLAAEEYERVVDILGPAEANRLRQPKRPATTTTAAAQRPEELVGALQDRVHRETGIARVAKSVRTRSGG